jgi:photosystem II stability/assembly factor-like uncharacterized protein
MTAKRWSLSIAGGLLLASVIGTGSVAAPAETIALSELPLTTHVHGLAVARDQPDQLLIATHHGLYRAGADGQAVRVSVVQDFMGFTPHPKEPGTLYASGHPPTGGNLGFIASTNRGKSWRQISPGLDGPVDFHQMTVSPADPNVIYGAYRGLQLSRDGGKSWTYQGALPAKLIDLAASAKAADTLYAATEEGLRVSSDAGKRWISVTQGAPVSVVEVLADGQLYAFIMGRGLVRIDEESKAVTVLSAATSPVLIHLASDPGDTATLYAATSRGVILASKDGGRGWTIFGAPGKP